MTTEYTPDDALNDLHVLEPVELPACVQGLGAFNRLEEYLTGLLSAATSVPTTCGYCFCYSPADEQCLSAEATHRDPRKNFGVNGCPWFVERSVLDADTHVEVGP